MMRNRPAYKRNLVVISPAVPAKVTRTTAHLPPEAREAYSGKVVLRLVRVDLCGYDALGYYVGDPHTPLWWCANTTGSIDFTFRVHTYEDAVSAVRTMYPNIRFYAECSK